MSKKKNDSTLLHFKLCYESDGETLQAVPFDKCINIIDRKWTYELKNIYDPSNSHFLLTITFQRRVQAKQLQALQELVEGGYDMIYFGVTTDGEKDQSVVNSTDSQVESFDLSDDYVSYFQTIQNDMTTAGTKVLDLANWRTSSSIDTSKLADCAKMHWSTDNKNWNNLLIARNDMFIKVSGPVDSADEVESDLSKFISEKIETPVYRVFIEQALSEFKHDWALVMAVSALEIAVKQTIKKIHPETDWLLREMPSPPVVKILRDYFPNLPSPFVEENGLALTADQLNDVKKSVAARNIIVHRGGIEWDVLKRFNAIATLELVIRWLEYYQGYKWSPRRAVKQANSGIAVG